jgi:serine/threonine-protein phosphatase 6 catalytic subunit
MNIDKMLEKAYRGECITEKECWFLCEKTKDLLIEESNVQPVQAPVNICGNIAGQFYDILELFKTGGSIPENKYVFMGGLLGECFRSIETLQLLFLLKVKYPESITILRGIRENRNQSKFWGFYDEILRKYGNVNVWKYCNEVFDCLPLAALVEDSIFCVQGGLSPDLKTIDQIRTLDRYIEPGVEGPLIDLLWSEPSVDVETWAVSSRGAGWAFGSLATKKFNQLNGLQLIAKGKNCVTEGHEYPFSEKSIVSICSAPNFKQRCDNKASILAINDNLERKFVNFQESPMSNIPIDRKKAFP